MSYEMDQMHGFSNDRDPLSPRRMNYRMNSGSTEEFQNMKEDTASIRSVQMIPTTRSSLRLVITNTWINLLLVVVPVSWVIFAVTSSPIAQFSTAVVSIIPLSRLLGFLSEEIALRCSPGVGSLVIISMGNVIELTIGIILLVTKCEIGVVQSSLVGAILSNLLLVLGACLFSGGLRFAHQGYTSGAAKLSSSILVVAVIGILVPASFDQALSTNTEVEASAPLVISMSHGLSIVLLLTYFSYVFFQLVTHRHIYHEVKYVPENEIKGGRVHKLIYRVQNRKDAASAGTREIVYDAEEEEESRLTVPVSIGATVVVMLCLIMASIFIAGSIDPLAQEYTGLNKQWLGLIVIPMVSNGSEQLSSIKASAKDRINFIMSISLGKSIQLALFVIPTMVIIGWGMSNPLTLLFNPFISIVLFLTVLITTYTINNGQSSTWFDGFVLLVTWAIVAISFWFYPDEEAPTAKFFAEHCRVVVHSFLTPPEGDGGNATEVFNHTSSGVGALAARAYTWL